MERLTRLSDLKILALAVAAGAILNGLRGWFQWEFEDV